MSVPKCPNHGSPLDGLPRPVPATGIGRCPVSGAEFEYTVDLDESKMTVERTIRGDLVKVPAYIVRGEE